MRRSVPPVPDGRDLTSRQRRIVEVVEDSVLSRGYSPSLREIGTAVGLASTSGVSYQLSELARKGYLSREAGRPRTARLRKPGAHPARAVRGKAGGPDHARVPLLGRIKAGTPMLADQVVEDVIALPRQLTGEGDFIMLEVVGDSMIDAAITDGDWVVVRRESDIENGDIVAAMIESESSADREATVKTFRRRDGHVWLVPQNPLYQPIMGDNAAIIGKVVTVLRRLR
jgi:repressor LexA